MLSAADSRATASGAVPQQVLGTRVPIAMRPQVEPLLAVRKNFQSLVTHEQKGGVLDAPAAATQKISA
jgi:hypothetical protein